jgi:3-oxoacyl-[acyl-carrier protein] reductase
MDRLDLELTGKTAFVTGAGQGVGREIARLLAAHGAKIAVNDFFELRASEVAHEIAEAGATAMAIAGDVADYDAIIAAVAEVHEKLGPIDILVNNAGNSGPNTGMARVDFWNTDPREWDRYMRVNLYGVLHCTRACVGGMVKQGFGRVISIISDAGRTGEQGHEAYSAAKAGTAGFSRALARAVGRYGVTANTISLSNIKREVSGENTISPEAVEMMLKRYIIRRQGLPRDVAAMVLFLASNESSWITGQNYPVNGGFSLSL